MAWRIDICPIFFSVFCPVTFFKASLRCILHNIKFTCHCASIITIQLQTTASPQKVSLFLFFSQTLLLPLVKLVFIVKCFLKMSYKWTHTVCNLLHLASFTYHNAFEVYPYCNVYSTLWKYHSLFTHQIKNIQIVFHFELLRIMLSTFAYKSLCGHMFAFLLGQILRSGMSGSYGKCDICFFNKLQNCFPKWLYTLLSHQQCITVPVSHILPNPWYGQSS